MEILKACGYWNIHVFMKEFLGDYASKPFARHHHEIFNCVARGERGVQRNIVAPRGSGKSALMTIVYPLHRVCYKEYDEIMGFVPDTFILILSKSYEMAISRILAIKAELEVNETLRAGFGNLVGDASWGIRRLVTANGVRITPLGRGGQIRGSLERNVRPSLIISDDLDDPETVENPDVRIKDQKWFDTDLIRAGSLDGTTNFINIDTIKHEEATASLLMNRSGWRTLFYRAIEEPADLWHPTHENLWKQWADHFTDMTVTDEERVVQADAFFEEHREEMMSGVKHLWEPVIDYKKVREEVCDVGYWAVLRELQNSCRDPSKAIFDMEGAVRFEVTDDGLFRSDGRLVKWNQISGGSVFLDWSSGKDAQDNAFAAAVCVLWEPMPGRTRNSSTLSGAHAYVLSEWMDRVKLTVQIDRAMDLLVDAQNRLASYHNTDMKWRFSIEDFIRDDTGAIKESARWAFMEARKQRELDIKLEFTKRFTDKVLRIGALEPAVSHGWLAFNEKLSPDYLKQMSLFPTADFMDAPDATEGACQLRVGEYPSVRDARRARQPKEHLVRLS